MKSSLQVLVLGAMLGAHASMAEGFLGVVNKADGTASIINVSTGATKTYKVGYLPHEIGVAAGRAYVSNYGSAHVRSSDLHDAPGNTLSTFSLSAPNEITNIAMGANRCAPHGIAASKDGRHIYVTCEGRLEIGVIDTSTGQLVHTIPTNQAGSHMIVVSSDESRAYVTNFWLGTVSVIDLVQRKLLKQIVVGRGCEGIGLSADDRSLYLTRVESSEVVMVDTQTLDIVHRTTLANGSSPIRVMAVPGHQNQILVNDVALGKLYFMSAVDLSLIKEVKVGNQPIGLAASNTHAFVANMKDKTISVINLDSAQIEAEFPTGAAPDGIIYFR